MKPPSTPLLVSAVNEPFCFVTEHDGKVELAPGNTAVVEWGRNGTFVRVLQIFPTPKQDP